MTTFKDFFYKAVLNQEKVKNASPSPLYPGSLIGDWEAYKGRKAKRCARCGETFSSEDDKVGGHVLKDGGVSIDYYVVPLCKACNHPTIKDPYYVYKSELVRLLDLKRNK